MALHCIPHLIYVTTTSGSRNTGQAYLSLILGVIQSQLRGVRENPSENYLIWCADHIRLHDTRGDENCGCCCGLTNGSLVKLKQLMEKKRGVRRGKTRGLAESARNSSPMAYTSVDFASVNECT